MTGEEWSPRLADLHAEVQRSRTSVAEARRAGRTMRELECAQVDLLAALQRLDDGLKAAGTTLPQHLRHELELLRLLVGRG
ncbi:hypothetical protein [Nocardioides aquiterrae]|uniref:Uncharacterized protein n=1 Tax=Nocardioides aquiterrae TaxID=203799 RepID=A0ABP4F2G2_9ACTN